MLAFLFSKIGAYLLGGALIAALLGGGYWYVGHLRSENALLTRQVIGYKRAVEILKNDLKLDKESQDEKDRIDKLDPTELADYFSRLRQRARETGTSPADDADD